MPAFKRFNRRLMLPGRSAYSLFDSFSVDVAAGSVNGTFSDKSHSERTVVDTENKLSISGGKLVFAGGKAAPDWNDPMYAYPAQAATKGTVGIWNFTTAAAGEPYAIIGFDDVAIKFRGTFINSVSNIDASDTAPNPGLVLTNGTAYTLYISLRTVGAYLWLKGGIYTYPTLFWVGVVRSAATVKAFAMSYNAAFTADEPRIPRRLWLPSPIAYDSFTRADGPLGVSNAVGPDDQSCISRAWSFPAGTAAISGNAAVISPVSGGEKVVNGNMSSAVGWIMDAGWSVSPTVATIVNGTAAYLQQANILPGVWYRISVDIVTITSGGLRVQLHGLVIGTDHTTTGTIVGTGRSTGIWINFQAISAMNGTIDNASVVPLTLASLFSSVTDAKTSDVLVDVKVAALTTGTQAGVAVRLDDATTPANFVLAYFDGAGNAKCDEVVAGVYTNLISAASVYAANATLRLDVSGTAVRLYTITSAGVAVLVGTATTNVVTGTRAGIFSTYNLNAFAAFQMFPKGTGNELAALDSL
jgi:hypothetical protein